MHSHREYHCVYAQLGISYVHTYVHMSVRTVCMCAPSCAMYVCVCVGGGVLVFCVPTLVQAPQVLWLLAHTHAHTYMADHGSIHFSLCRLKTRC